MFMESGFDYCGYWSDGEKIVFQNVKDCLDEIPEDFHFYFQDNNEEDEEEEEM